MNILFAIAANGFISRQSSYRTLIEEWGKIDRQRIVADVDFDHCFCKNGIQSLGFTGGEYFRQARNIHQALQDRINNGMYIGNIPATFAKESTGQVLLSRACARMATERLYHYFKPFMDSDMLDHKLDRELQKESRLQLMYLGDWLDALEDTIALKGLMTVDIALWHGDKAIQIVRNLQQLADYSEYNHDHTPPGNDRGDQDEDERAAPSPLPLKAAPR